MTSLKSTEDTGVVVLWARRQLRDRRRRGRLWRVLSRSRVAALRVKHNHWMRALLGIAWEYLSVADFAGYRRLTGFCSVLARNQARNEVNLVRQALHVDARDVLLTWLNKHAKWYHNCFADAL